MKPMVEYYPVQLVSGHVMQLNDCSGLGLRKLGS